MFDFEVDIIGSCDLWRGHEDGLSTALAAAATELGVSGVVSLLLGNDGEIAALNQQFRHKQGPTNVLSFPPTDNVEPGFLGDIAIAAETVAAEAQFQGKSFEAHAAHLAVHGFLHLLGYDHENEADASRMEARERAILMSIGIDDPYA